MSNDVDLSIKYKPLFSLFDPDNHKDVDTVIITGGRYSLKSYTVSVFSLMALVNYGWNVLYTRFTSMSIVDSVKPEVSDKIELLGLNSHVVDTNTHIERGRNRIAFKGIKSGSKGQTANLKSLSGFNVFVNDEAEELPDYATFKKIYYSIRSQDKRNLTILILNPTTEEHWVYKEFFEKRGVEGGSNLIKDNVMYIHASYLDADQEQMPKNILADYQRIKKEDPAMYENVVMGGWVREVEGQVFPRSTLNFYDKLPAGDKENYYTVSFADTADEGTDRFSMPIARIYGNRVYLIDAIFDQANLTIQEGQVKGKVDEHDINILVIETNSFGAYFARRMRELLPGKEIFGQYAKANKMARILANSGLIKRYFYFPNDPTPALEMFIKQVTRLLNTDKEQDDAPDSLAGLSAYLEKMHSLFKE